MSTIPVTDPHKAWNVKQFKRLEAYNARLQKLLDNAIKKAAAIALRHDAKASDEHLFSFSDDRQMKAEVDKLMKELSAEMTSFIKSAEEAEWKKAYEQAAAYIGALYKTVADIKELQERSAEAFLTMRTRNLDALEAFRKRKIGGLSLSKKVWNYTQDFGRQMEVAIDTALMQGKSAAALSRDIRSLLTDPNALFRRVRDENDQLRMSKAMEAYHPGTGRYRSAYKNAMRLASSEINMAYRASDCNVAMMSDDCVGIEIHLSNNHNCKGVPKGEFYDICDQLAGRYPKGFNFTGWHPQCRCFITYVLKTDEEHRRDIMTGTNGDSVNTVKDVPDSFKEWVKENEGRIEAAEKKGTAPYFINDNKATVDGILGKKQSVKVESSIVGKDAAGNPITHEQWYGTSPAGKKPTESQDAIKAAKAEYDSLPDKEWHKDKFYEATGGFLVTHVLKDKDNLALKGIAAEVQACSILSNSGKKVMRLPENVFDDIDNITIDGIKYRELLKFKEGSKVPRGYPDAYFDSQTWDFKTSEFAKVDSVRKLIKDGRKADNVIFIVNEESDIEIIKHALKSEKGSRAKNGTWKELPNVYYLKNGKLESIWIK